MKNKYFIDGEVVTVLIKYKKEVLETLVDIDDLEKLLDTDVRWYGNERGGHIYVVTSIGHLNGGRNAMKLHQFILGFPSEDKNLIVDHINRNSLDNRKSNLRVVTKVENAQNSNISTNNTSGAKGVYFHKRDKVWMARISINGKRKYLGSYSNKGEAIKARKNAELKYWV